MKPAHSPTKVVKAGDALVAAPVEELVPVEQQEQQQLRVRVPEEKRSAH